MFPASPIQGNMLLSQICILSKQKFEKEFLNNFEVNTELHYFAHCDIKSKFAKIQMYFKMLEKTVLTKNDPFPKLGGWVMLI